MPAHLSPSGYRILPYAAFLGFLAVEEALALGAVRFEALAAFDLRWLYPAKAVVVALLLAWAWPHLAELRVPLPRLGTLLVAVAAGVGVWAMWISLDQSWATLGEARGYDPRDADGRIDWLLAGFRMFGAALVVPLMEELFWRSFVMRWLKRQDFLAVPPHAVGWVPFLITAVLFGVQHHLWLAGVLTGIVYGLLYVRTGNLWVPLLAHAVTNAALGVWVLAYGQWQFW